MPDVPAPPFVQNHPVTIPLLAITYRPLQALIPYIRNARTHSDTQVAQIAASIREFGWTNPILVDGDSGVIAGHGRLLAARQLGLTEVPVIELASGRRPAPRLRPRRQPPGAERWLGRGTAAAGARELQALDFDLDLLGFDDDELQALLAVTSRPSMAWRRGCGARGARGPGVRPAVWLLGAHRLLCGDATVAASYDTLLQGSSVDMVFTDPPYNVNYANSAKDKMRGKDRAILNDNLGTGFQDFLQSALAPMLAHCRGAVYVAMSSSELDTLQTAFRAAGGHWSTFIIWAKHTFTLGRADYQRQYEPILYGWPEGAERHWCGDRDQGDVWNIKKPHKNDLHPTMKPVELVERAIRNSSRPGQVVLDPFCGSGTTLIAAEKSARVARLIELDPHYADVIVRRWQDWTGQQATRASDDVTFNTTSSEERQP